MDIIEKLQKQFDKVNQNFYMGQRIHVSWDSDSKSVRVCDEHVVVTCDLEKLEIALSCVTGKEGWVKIWSMIDVAAISPSEIVLGAIVKPRNEAYSSLTSGCGTYEVAIVLDKDPFTLVSLNGDMAWGCTCRIVDFDIIGYATPEQMERVEHRR